MSLLQQPLERKLSALLGTTVTFAQFKLSLLKGSIEILDATVAGEDPALPLLTIRRLFAEISIARAMKKEIVVKSLSIERPVLALRRRADGTLNLPRRPQRPAAPPEAAAPQAAPAEAGQSSLPVLEAQKVLLVDGAVSFHDETCAPAYHLALDGLQASLQQAGQTLTLTLLSDAVGRRDRPVELGPLRAAATFRGAAHLGRLPEASASAEATLGQALRLTAQSPRLADQTGEITLAGPLDLPTLLALLPAVLAGRLPQTAGQVELEVKARYSPAQGLEIPTADVRIRDLTLRW